MVERVKLPEQHHNVRSQVDLDSIASAAGKTIQDYKKKVKLNDETKAIFLGYLSEVPNISLAASKIGVSYNTVATHRAMNPAFDEACEEAISIAISKMEDEVHRRAFRGVPKGIYFQGKKVSEELQYSDTLALRSLEALAPTKWSPRSNLNVKSEVEVNVSDAKMKLLDLLNVDESEIVEGEFTEE